MATFYLLPPRACLEQALADVLARLLPGLPLPADSWDAVAERFASGWPANVFLVPRDDLAEGEPIDAALAAGFGAEPGDRVIEVPLTHGSGPARTWMIEPAGVCGSVAAR